MKDRSDLRGDPMAVRWRWALEMYHVTMLTERQRRTVERRYRDRATFAVIAAEQGVSVARIKDVLKLAGDRLARHFGACRNSERWHPFWSDVP